MKIEVINTGTELLLGNVTNTHLPFLGQELFPLGARIERQVCVPDGPAIREALLASFAGGADVVLVTGGLGPTSDDLTRDIAAELLGRPLSDDAEVLAVLQAYYARHGRKMLPGISRQAQVPAGATVIPNHHGTAPGLYLPPTPLHGKPGEAVASPHLFLLPGPPRELRPMFTEQIVPMIAALRPVDEAVPQVSNYRLINIGESNVEAMVGALLAKIEGLEIGYCARLGEVDLRLIGSPAALVRADEIVAPAVAPYLLSMGSDNLEEVLVRRLAARGQTLAVAESCTGGLLAHRLTNVPGSSAVLLAGLVTYSVAAKAKLLGIEPALFERYDAVSQPVAAAMAEGARRATGADFALATTGYAGPGGGERPDSDPVGTVYVALAAEEMSDLVVERHMFLSDRETFKYRAAQAALDLLRRNSS